MHKKLARLRMYRVSLIQNVHQQKKIDLLKEQVYNLQQQVEQINK